VQTGRRFVAVAAAGDQHSLALALTEEGHVYGWNDSNANGHGTHKSKPQLVSALAGERVVLLFAQNYCSCALTELGLT